MRPDTKVLHPHDSEQPVTAYTAGEAPVADGVAQRPETEACRGPAMAETSESCCTPETPQGVCCAPKLTLPASAPCCGTAD